MGHDAGAPRETVRLFTDGACSGNPGPGDGLSSCVHPASGQTIESSGAEPHTTNNRMELAGVIEGLSSLKRPCHVELVTDSQYVAKGIAEWLPKWKRQGWQRKEGRTLQAGVERRPLAKDRLTSGNSPGSGDARSRAIEGTPKTRHAIAWPSRLTSYSSKTSIRHAEGFQPRFHAVVNEP